MLASCGAEAAAAKVKINSLIPVDPLQIPNATPFTMADNTGSITSDGPSVRPAEVSATTHDESTNLPQESNNDRKRKRFGGGDRLKHGRGGQKGDLGRKEWQSATSCSPR